MEKPRPSRAGPIVFLLLLLAGGAAGWWLLSGREVGAPDPSASQDLEIVEGSLDEEGPADFDDPAPVEVTPTPAASLPADSPLGAELPLDSGLPLDSAAGALIITDTLPQDTSAIAPGEFPPDTAPTAPDTARPPPRVLGVPVDSVPPSSGGPAADEANSSQPLSLPPD